MLLLEKFNLVLGEVHLHRRNFKELTEKHFQAWILRFNLIQLSLIIRVVAKTFFGVNDAWLFMVENLNFLTKYLLGAKKSP